MISMLTKSFGRNNGVEIKEAILENKNNHISIISYGAITKSWIVSHGRKRHPFYLVLILWLHTRMIKILLALLLAV